jgi:hypothetical protein
MQDNPFAPPSAAATSKTGRALVFSPEGAAIVASLATWMRGMSLLLYIGVGGLALASCGLLVAGEGNPAAIGGTIAFVVIGVLVALASSWLRGAADGFERGVSSDDEFTIGQGFRNLRAYLILMGVFSILSLLNTVCQMNG